MKRVILSLSLVFTFTVYAFGAVCGGRGYRGVSADYCLRCHKSGCSILHPAKGIKVIEKECLKVPIGFPLDKGKLTCTTCHDMTSRNKYFLRSNGNAIKNELDFCFECHVKSCYRKFNPHKSMVVNGKYNAKVCVYCHGMGWRRPAYKLCVGCHTLAPHPGAYEHLIASTKTLDKYIKEGKVVNVRNFYKDGRERLMWYKEGKPILISGKMTCITCHNPHPMTASVSLPVSFKWRRIEDKDFEYKLERFYKKLGYYSVNSKSVNLMVKTSNNGRLCLVCHSINSLK